MRRRMVLGLVIVILLVISLTSVDASAKTYAWLIDNTESKADKLDIEANKIVQKKVLEGLRTSVTLQDVDSAIFADTANKLLYVIYDYPCRFCGQGVRIYSLSDLSLKKDLGITSDEPDGELPKIVASPAGNKFYVIWWDKSKAVDGKSGETYSEYDKATLNKLNDLASFPINLNRPYMYSLDGKRIYSIDVYVSEIKVYDGRTLNLGDTISISGIWGSPLYLKSLAANNSVLGSGDKLLLEENIKNTKAEPNNIKFFSYDIASRSISNKISIKEASYQYLTPDGTKIIANEVDVSYRGTSVAGINHLNKVHIYDIVTGQKLKALDLSAKYKSLGVSGISPDSSKLYLAAENIQSGATTLVIVDLKTYNIAAELPVEGTWMIFFEE